MFRLFQRLISVRDHRRRQCPQRGESLGRVDQPLVGWLCRNGGEASRSRGGSWLWWLPNAPGWTGAIHRPDYASHISHTSPGRGQYSIHYIGHVHISSIPSGLSDVDFAHFFLGLPPRLQILLRPVDVTSRVRDLDRACQHTSSVMGRDKHEELTM